MEIKNQLPFHPTDIKQKYFSFKNTTKSENSDDKLKKAAQDFEAIFVAQILHNMQRSISASSLFGEGIAGDIYKSLFNENMAQAIASKNGLHLSDIIIKSLQKTESHQENNSGLTISDYRLHPIRPVFKQESDDDWDRSIIREAAENFKVEAKLIEAMIKVESNNHANAVSNKGAVGLMQLTKSTAEKLGVKNRFNPKENVFGGVKYLKSLLVRFQDNLRFALSAYNAGPAAVEKYHGIPPYPETQHYVQKVLQHYREM